VFPDPQSPAADRPTDLDGVLLSLLRFVVGFLFICHGASKLFNVLGGSMGGGKAAVLGSLMWYSGVIEFFGGILLLVGLLTQVTALIIAIEMVVAYIKVHVPRGPWPLLNRGELPVVYFFLLLYLVSVGGGPFSLDRVVLRRRRPNATSALSAARMSR
jgi:putative oxidoreductase